jgi:predicted MFS family arabinose efflux permease
MTASERRALLAAALGLALAAAVSLGLARFAYALLLPAMRADLGWSYFTAGAMNAVNAAGYLAGALAMPLLLARFDARRVLLAGGGAAALLLALHGATRSDAVMYLLRAATGVASAASFVGGGLLAARLAQSASGGARSGLVLGLYYGGTGLGIVGAALGLPPLLAERSADWPLGWLALGALAGLATWITARTTRALHAPPQASGERQRFPWPAARWALAGYAMFGLGYIGYMTFVITLLRDAGHGASTVAAFFVLLGLGTVASSWLWAGLLQRTRDGRALALLNGLLALATALLALWPRQPALAFVSGALFGAVMLSVVASTTAFVRHNAAPGAWPAGIAAFTIVFAFGQIVGPGLVGWVADAGGGLVVGFGLSAALLAFGALLAALQRPLVVQPPASSAKVCANS